MINEPISSGISCAINNNVINEFLIKWVHMLIKPLEQKINLPVLCKCTQNNILKEN